ncbi:60S ribosomal protein L6 [Binucleata daphniae]
MIKNLKINLNPKNAGLYPAEDLPKYVETLEKHNKVQQRKQREDIKPGQVVVVLEGKFASQRVIMLQQISNNKAICIGYSETNIPLFIIDERFLFATSVCLPINEKINEEGIKESSTTNVDEEFSVCEKSKRMHEIVDKCVTKVKGMKRYLCTPFCVPEGKDVYAINF